MLAAAAVVSAVPIFTRDLWTPDEPRYAEVAREMMVSGDFLVPRRNGETYREKPPLLFWSMSAAALPFGGMNDIAARIPSLAAALLVLVLTHDLARRMFSPRVGLWSALILATTGRFWWQSNTGEIDMLLTGCTTLSLYALWRWHESRQSFWGLAFHAGTALGLLAKGPPALVVTLLGAIVFRWRDKAPGKGLRLWIGVPLSLVPVAAWFLLSRRSAGGEISGEISSTFYRQVVGRMFTAVHHGQPPWYYALNAPVEWAPWSIFLAFAAIHAWKHRRGDPAMRLLLAWILPALLFFHISTGKRTIYLLPLFPPIAILLALGLLAIVDEGRRGWLRASAIVWMPCLAIAGVAPLLLSQTAYAEFSTPRIWLFSAVAALAFAWCLAILRAGAWRHWPVALATQGFALLFAGGIAILPAINTIKSPKAFCAPVRALAQDGPVHAYTLAMLREEYVYYSKTLQQRILDDPGAAALSGPESGRAVELRLLMGKACEGITLTSFTRPTPAERAALRAAIGEELNRAGLPPETVAAHHAAVAKTVADSMALLAAPEPAVLFAQRKDWRWVLAFAEDASFLTLLKDERVSSRFVLLLANPAAVEQLDRMAGAPMGSSAAGQ